MKELGNELHDGVGQWLTAAGMYCKVLKGKIDPEQDGWEDLEHLEELIDKAQDEIRFLSYSLSGVDLENLSFEEGIRSLLNRYQGLPTAPRIHADLKNLEDASFCSKEKHSIFRVIQEFLNNSLKYSNADQVWMLFEKGPEEVRLHLEDDGKGFDPKEVREEGLGLRSMENRILEIGGTMKIESAPGEGVRMEIMLPPPD